jgi:drug/metabolite transporter (DMT)-like permease
VAAALAATYLFFGSGPAAAAAGIKSLPPFLMVACRGLIAGVILIVWALADGTPGPSWREWRSSATQLTIPSGVAGVLSALLPLIAAVIGYVFLSEKLPIRAVAGLIIGFTGIGLLLRPGSGFDVLA